MTKGSSLISPDSHMFPASAKPLSTLIVSLFCVVVTFQVTSAGPRTTQRPGKPVPSLSRSHESGFRDADGPWVQKNGSVVDEESDTTLQSMRMLPPPDMIIDSFLRSPHGQRVTSQSNLPPKQLVRSLFPSHSGGSRSGRRLSPPGTQRRPSDRRPSDQRSLSASPSSLSNEIESLVPGLSRLQKHAIPIDSISKDIESTIQRIVQDIVSRREKVFYHLPNNGQDKGSINWVTGNRDRGVRQEERMRMPVLQSQSGGRMRHLPPPPSAHRGLHSDSERPAGNELVPYYAMARNGLGPGLKSFSDFVKKVSQTSDTCDYDCND